MRADESRRGRVTGDEIDLRVRFERLRQERQKTLQECERTKDMRWARHLSMLKAGRSTALTAAVVVSVIEVPERWPVIVHLVLSFLK